MLVSFARVAPEWGPYASTSMGRYLERPTVIASISVVDGQVVEASSAPCLIDVAGTPQYLVAGDEGFAQVVAHLRRVTEEAGFATRFHERGDALG